MESIDFEKWKFKDVYRHWKEDTYEEVQAVFDSSYNKLPAPSKILAGALEFDIEKLDKVESVSIDLKTRLF